ncbi:MAG TPA: class I SAM-dependent methyltransferase [Noviherbaspirillum sp.]|uniref:class I SAM-dependent methyltransferase n=1 Tax=Noviherbaspirillum sp. TaxID=1926288 RepID=UPI002B464E76|nr:class I SAM-dependent methyltransferase [Noviherbaspirillum sp.]HJV86112.1 class I SAM-dependent methyltransferase [Noviherbaspirillum sp.]
MKNAIDADYGAAPAGGYIDKILSTQRRKLFDAFMAFKQGDSNGSVLNVGIVPDHAGQPADPLAGRFDYVLAWSTPQQRAGITSYHLGAPAGARRQQPGDMRLPFADSQFDWVVCNEVIERVGDFEKQFALVQELGRVCGKGLFVTTSNRRHPIEFNTRRPFLHWLPRTWWRRALAWTGKGKSAGAATLNLVDSAALYKFASLLPGKPEHDVGHKRVFGIKAHFFLMVRKERS